MTKNRSHPHSLWLRCTSLGMAVVFFYVQVAYGVIEPALKSRKQGTHSTLWEERKAAAERLKESETEQEEDQDQEKETLLAKVAAPKLDNGILSQIPSLNLNLLPNSIPKTVVNSTKINLQSDVKSRFEVLPSWFKALSISYASLTDLYLPPNWKPGDFMVVHIQDAHENYEAQKNIAKIIESLEKSSQAQALDSKNFSSESNSRLIVGLEGASGSFNFSLYRLFPKKQIVKEVADYLLKESLISGPEYVGMTINRLPLFWGIEDKDLYLQHIQAFKDSAPLEKRAKQSVKELETKIEQLKETVFNQELKNFDRAVTQYTREGIKLSAYLKILTKKGIPSTALMIQRYMNALYLEESMDYDRVEKERRALTNELVEKLSKQEMNDLVSASLSYRVGNISYGSFYQYLKDLCQAYQVKLREYPEMDKYIRYVLISDQIKSEELFIEISSLEQKRIELLIQNSKEKELIQTARGLELLNKLVHFQLSPEEWEEYQKSKKKIEELISGRIKGHLSSDQKSLEDQSSSSSNFLNIQSLQPFEQFNQAGISRNQSLINNLLKKSGIKESVLEPSSQNRIAVLVAGGFHTSGITQILKNKQLAYCVLTPKLKVVEGTGTEYLEIFRRDKTPLEKLFTGERITLKSPLGTGTPISLGNEWAPIFTVLERMGESLLLAELIKELGSQVTDIAESVEDEILKQKSEWVEAVKAENGLKSTEDIDFEILNDERDINRTIQKLVIAVNIRGEKGHEDSHLIYEILHKDSKLAPGIGKKFGSSLKSIQLGSYTFNIYKDKMGFTRTLISKGISKIRDIRSLTDQAASWLPSSEYPGYTKNVAWWFEQLVSFGVGAIAYFLLPGSHQILVPLIAGLTFWLPHLVFNRKAFFSKNVIVVTGLTALVAAMPLFGFWSLALLNVILLTIYHRSINLKAIQALQEVTPAVQISQAAKYLPPISRMARLKNKLFGFTKWAITFIVIFTTVLSVEAASLYHEARLIGEGFQIEHVFKTPLTPNSGQAVNQKSQEALQELLNLQRIQNLYQTGQLDHFFNGLRTQPELLYQFFAEIANRSDSEQLEFSRYFASLKSGTRQQVFAIFYKRLRQDLFALEAVNDIGNLKAVRFSQSAQTLERMENLYATMAQVLNRTQMPLVGDLPGEPVAPKPMMGLTRSRAVANITNLFTGTVKKYREMGYRVRMPIPENLNASELAQLIGYYDYEHEGVSFLEENHAARLLEWVMQQNDPGNPNGHRVTDQELFDKAMKFCSNPQDQTIDLFKAIATVGHYYKCVTRNPQILLGAVWARRTVDGATFIRQYHESFLEFSWMLDPGMQLTVNDLGQPVVRWHNVDADGNKLILPGEKPEIQWFETDDDLYHSWNMVLLNLYLNMKSLNDVIQDSKKYAPKKDEPYRIMTEGTPRLVVPFKILKILGLERTILKLMHFDLSAGDALYGQNSESESKAIFSQVGDALHKNLIETGLVSMEKLQETILPGPSPRTVIGGLDVKAYLNGIVPESVWSRLNQDSELIKLVNEQPKKFWEIVSAVEQIQEIVLHWETEHPSFKNPYPFLPDLDDYRINGIVWGGKIDPQSFIRHAPPAWRDKIVNPTSGYMPFREVWFYDKLTNDADPEIALYTALHGRLPVESFVRIAEGQNQALKNAIINNPHIPPLALILLSQDPAFSNHALLKKKLEPYDNKMVERAVKFYRRHIQPQSSPETKRTLLLSLARAFYYFNLEIQQLKTPEESMARLVWDKLSDKDPKAKLESFTDKMNSYYKKLHLSIGPEKVTDHREIKFYQLFRLFESLFRMNRLKTSLKPAIVPGQNAATLAPISAAEALQKFSNISASILGPKFALIAGFLEAHILLPGLTLFSKSIMKLLLLPVVRDQGIASTLVEQNLKSTKLTRFFSRWGSVIFFAGLAGSAISGTSLIMVPVTVLWMISAGFVFAGSHKGRSKKEQFVLGIVGALLAGVTLTPALLFYIGIPIPSVPLIGEISNLGEALGIGLGLNVLLHTLYNAVILGARAHVNNLISQGKEPSRLLHWISQFTLAAITGPLAAEPKIKSITGFLNLGDRGQDNKIKPAKISSFKSDQDQAKEDAKQLVHLIFSGQLADYPLDEVILKINQIPGIEFRMEDISLSNITLTPLGDDKNINKWVFKVSLTPSVHLVLGMTKKDSVTGITEQEIEDFERLSESSLTPRLIGFGQYRSQYVVRDYLLLEFIEGPTAAELIDQGQFSPEKRRAVVDTILEISKVSPNQDFLYDEVLDETMLMIPLMMPMDINEDNFILKRQGSKENQKDHGTPTVRQSRFQQFGKASLDKKDSLREDLKKKKVKAVMIDLGGPKIALGTSLATIIQYYGYFDKDSGTNDFIFQSFLEIFGMNNGLNLLKENLAYMKRTKMLRETILRSGFNPSNIKEIKEELILLNMAIKDLNQFLQTLSLSKPDDFATRLRHSTSLGTGSGQAQDGQDSPKEAKASLAQELANMALEGELERTELIVMSLLNRLEKEKVGSPTYEGIVGALRIILSKKSDLKYTLPRDTLERILMIEETANSTANILARFGGIFATKLYSTLGASTLESGVFLYLPHYLISHLLHLSLFSHAGLLIFILAAIPIFAAFHYEGKLKDIGLRFIPATLFAVAYLAGAAIGGDIVAWMSASIVHGAFNLAYLNGWLPDWFAKYVGLAAIGAGGTGGTGTLTPTPTPAPKIKSITGFLTSETNGQESKHIELPLDINNKPKSGKIFSFRKAAPPVLRVIEGNLSRSESRSRVKGIAGQQSQQQERASKPSQVSNIRELLKPRNMVLSIRLLLSSILAVQPSNAVQAFNRFTANIRSLSHAVLTGKSALSGVEGQSQSADSKEGIADRILQEEKVNQKIQHGEILLAKEEIEKIAAAILQDTKSLNSALSFGLRFKLEELMNQRMNESLEKEEFKKLKQARTSSIGEALTLLMKDYDQLISLETVANNLSNQKRSAVLIMTIFHFLILQDEADLKLPFVPHSIKHSLNVRKEVGNIIDGSPTIKANLKEYYGEIGVSLAFLSAWLHDIGYGILIPAIDEANRTAKQLEKQGHIIAEGYEAEKGYHTDLGVTLAETPLDGKEREKGTNTLTQQLDLILGLKQLKGNALDSNNALEDLLLVVKDHGADKEEVTEDGLRGTGKHKIRPASNQTDILNFLVRMADNLDSVAYHRLYDYQNNPFFIDYLRQMETAFIQDGKTVGAHLESMRVKVLKDMPTAKMVYAHHLEVDRGLTREEAINKSKNEFDLMELYVKEHNGKDYPHFAGMLYSQRVEEDQDGNLVVLAELNDFNRNIPKDLHAFQLNRMKVAYESLRFNGRKILIKDVNASEVEEQNRDKSLDTREDSDTNKKRREQIDRLEQVIERAKQVVQLEQQYQSEGFASGLRSGQAEDKLGEEGKDSVSMETPEDQSMDLEPQGFNPYQIPILEAMIHYLKTNPGVTFEEITKKQGDQMISRNDSSEDVYIVLDGIAEVFKGGYTPDRIPNSLTPGSVLGDSAHEKNLIRRRTGSDLIREELSVQLSNYNRAEDVFAGSDRTMLYRLSGQQFQELFRDPQFLVAYAGLLHSRSPPTRSKIVSAKRTNLISRLAQSLKPKHVGDPLTSLEQGRKRRIEKLKRLKENELYKFKFAIGDIDNISKMNDFFGKELIGGLTKSSSDNVVFDNQDVPLFIKIREAKNKALRNKVHAYVGGDEFIPEWDEGDLDKATKTFRKELEGRFVVFKIKTEELTEEQIEALKALKGAEMMIRHEDGYNLLIDRGEKGFFLRLFEGLNKIRIKAFNNSMSKEILKILPELENVEDGITHFEVTPTISIGAVDADQVLEYILAKLEEEKWNLGKKAEQLKPQWINPKTGRIRKERAEELYLWGIRIANDMVTIAKNNGKDQAYVLGKGEKLLDEEQAQAEKERLEKEGKETAAKVREEGKKESEKLINMGEYREAKRLKAKKDQEAKLVLNEKRTLASQIKANVSKPITLQKIKEERKKLKEEKDGKIRKGIDTLTGAYTEQEFRAILSKNERENIYQFKVSDYGLNLIFGSPRAFHNMNTLLGYDLSNEVIQIVFEEMKIYLEVQGFTLEKDKKGELFVARPPPENGLFASDKTFAPGKDMGKMVTRIKEQLDKRFTKELEEYIKKEISKKKMKLKKLQMEKQSTKAELKQIAKLEKELANLERVLKNGFTPAITLFHVSNENITALNKSGVSVSSRFQIISMMETIDSVYDNLSEENQTRFKEVFSLVEPDSGNMKGVNFKPENWSELMKLYRAAQVIKSNEAKLVLFPEKKEKSVIKKKKVKPSVSSKQRASKPKRISGVAMTLTETRAAASEIGLSPYSWTTEVLFAPMYEFFRTFNPFKFYKDHKQMGWRAGVLAMGIALVWVSMVGFIVFIGYLMPDIKHIIYIAGTLSLISGIHLSRVQEIETKVFNLNRWNELSFINKAALLFVVPMIIPNTGIHSVLNLLFRIARFLGFVTTNLIEKNVESLVREIETKKKQGVSVPKNLIPEIIRGSLLNPIADYESLERFQVSDNYQNLLQSLKLLQFAAILKNQNELNLPDFNITELSNLGDKEKALLRTLRYMSETELFELLNILDRLSRMDNKKMKESFGVWSEKLIESAAENSYYRTISSDQSKDESRFSGKVPIIPEQKEVQITADQMVMAYQGFTAILSPKSKVSQEQREMVKKVWENAIKSSKERLQSAKSNVKDVNSLPVIQEIENMRITGAMDISNHNPSDDQINLITQQITLAWIGKTENIKGVVVPLITNQDSMNLETIERVKKRLEDQGRLDIAQELNKNIHFAVGTRGDLLSLIKERVKKDKTTPEIDPSIEMDPDDVNQVLISKIQEKVGEISKIQELSLKLFTENVNRYKKNWKSKIQIYKILPDLKVVEISKEISDTLQARRVLALQQ